MKVKFTDRFASREGQEREVTDAAGRRLIAQGVAEQVDVAPKPKPKPAAKKAPAKKAAKKAK